MTHPSAALDFDRWPGQWYRGALHVHTLCSDGRLSPERSMAAHREQGYHFMATTDHDVITDLSASSDAGFLNIPSVEVCYDRNALGQSYHLVVLGVRQMIDLPRETPVQEAIDRWTAAGGTVFLAHAYWSGMSSQELIALENLAGMEIYNTSADTDLGKGLSVVHWDEVLVRGKRWWGYAVDDTHWMSENGRVFDAFGGWTWVKAEVLSEEAILAALREGRFYSSSGPQIHEFAVEDGVARVRCSGADKINFIGHTQWGSQVRAEPGETITEATHRLTGKEGYLRVECIDAQGRSAWANPVFF